MLTGDTEGADGRCTISVGIGWQGTACTKAGELCEVFCAFYMCAGGRRGINKDSIR